MDATSGAEINRQLEWGADDDAEIARAFIRSHMVNVHTAMPAIIKSFDAARQTVEALPALQRLFLETDGDEEGGFRDHSICVDVPLHVVGGGGFHQTFPVREGDECLLVFSERAIDYWHEHGGTQMPASMRMHDLSDAAAFVGIHSKPHLISSYATDAAELRNDDASIVVRLEQAMLHLGARAGGESAVKADSHLPKLGDVLDSMGAAIAKIGAGLASLGYTAAAEAIADVGTKLIAYHAASTTYPTSKVKVT